MYLSFYRLRSAKVLLIGLGGFGAEIAKNVILAGVKTITLLDHRNVTIEDTCSQFFIPNDQIGKNVCKLFIDPFDIIIPFFYMTLCIHRKQKHLYKELRI